jgi:hypothetical protein
VTEPPSFLSSFDDHALFAANRAREPKLGTFGGHTALQKSARKTADPVTASAYISGMTKPPRITYADKQAMLARGEPWVVHPREVAKLPEFHGTDPEIILSCILEAGILDTGDILKTAINQRLGLAVTDQDTAAYELFRRVWQRPTDEQRRAVSARALRIVKASRTRRRALHWPTTH